MTPWLYTPIIHIHTPTVAGGGPMSSITEKALAEAVERAERSERDAQGWMETAQAWQSAAEEWERRALAAQELSDEQVAQIIDQHRVNERWVGSCVGLVCACGHESLGGWVKVDPSGKDHEAHRIADRAHAVHVAAQLRAARDTSEQASAVGLAPEKEK